MLFSTMDCQPKDDVLFKKVRSYKGKDWGTKLIHIQSLRKRFLELQNNRCVYCQSSIDANSNGHRELEHILPKSPSKDITNCDSNLFEDRRSTRGYPEFSFEPLNLCLSCKVCNPKKGTFDPLKNRAISPVSYPKQGDFLWFHPHFDIYSKHITLNDDFTFTKVTDEGDAVITACGLDDAKLLAERFLSRAEATVSRNKNSKLSRLVNAVATDIDQKKYGFTQGVTAIITKYPKTDFDAVLKTLTLWCEHLEDDDNLLKWEKARGAVSVIAASLTRAGSA